MQREDEKVVSDEDNRNLFECDDERKYTLLDHPFDRESVYTEAVVINPSTGSG